jgi:hypothetical protein
MISPVHLNILSELSSLSGSLILGMGFGYEVNGHNDRKVNAAKQLVDLAGAATFPGALLVNDLPFRKCHLATG